MKYISILFLVFMFGCAELPPEKVMKRQGEAQRPPDLYLIDGTPCWYLRKPQAHGRSRLLCDLRAILVET